MPWPLASMSWGCQETSTDGGSQDDGRGQYATAAIEGIEGGDDEEYVVTTVQEYQKQTKRRRLLSLCFLVASLTILAACGVVAAVVLKGGDIGLTRKHGSAPDGTQSHLSPSGGDSVDQKADAIVNGLFELINKYCISDDPDDVLRCQEACSPGECCFVTGGEQDNGDCSMTEWCMDFAKCQAVYDRESDWDNP